MAKSRKERKATKPKRTWLRVMLGIVIIFLVGIGTYFAYIYNNVKET